MPAGGSEAPASSTAAEEDFESALSGDDLDSIMLEPPETQKPPTPSGQQTQPVVTPQPPAGQTEAQQTAPTPTPAAAPSSPASAAAETQQEAAGEAPKSPAEFLEKWMAGKDTLVQIFAENQFKLNSEEIEALGIDPKAAPQISRMMGNVAFYSIQAAQKMIMDQVPAMVAEVLSETSERQSSVQQFYARWPKLKDPKYTETINEFSKAFRRQYPKASFQERVEAVGKKAMAFFELSVAQTPAKGNGLAPAGFVPATSAPSGNRAEAGEGEFDGAYRDDL